MDDSKTVPPSSSNRTGVMLAVFLVALVIAALWLFPQREWWLPRLASAHGADIDYVFFVTLAITGVLFVLLQGILAFLVLRNGSERPGRASYWIRPRLEARFALWAGLLIFAVDVTIYALGESQWFKVWGAPPDGTMIVEVTGEQFAWNFRYPGEDGSFGRTDPTLVSGANPLGVDRNDPAAADDVLSINQLHLPEGKPVRLRIRSKDVVHSLYMPYQRVKQDAVPGMQIQLWFIPTVSGQYEIACSQLCGLGHYRMRAFLTVEPQMTFDQWLRDSAKGGV